MRFPILCIKDRVANRYKPPMTFASIPEAIREFTVGINNTTGQNLMNKYPDDFELVHTGMFDDETGKSYANDDVTVVCLGKDVYKPPTREEELQTHLFNQRNTVH